MRRLGQGECRTRSGSPAGASGFIRSAADFAPPSPSVFAASRRRRRVPVLAADTIAQPAARRGGDARCLCVGALAARPPRDRSAGADARHSVLCGGHRHPARAHAPPPGRDRGLGARRDAGARARADRVYALLRSEPQIMVAWAAAGDEPEIIGDPSLVGDRPSVPHQRARLRHLARSRAGAGDENAVEALAGARRRLRA